MDLKIIKDILKDYYVTKHLEIGDNQLICPPNKEVWRLMIERNSTVEKEIRKLNSSSALSLNFHEMIHEVYGVTVNYEVPVFVPLCLDEGKGHPAMLDAVYEHNNAVYYVESKFLEPYYTLTKHVSKSYMNPQLYPNQQVGEKWGALFNKVDTMIEGKEFRYYDINQMLKHLLAIYRTSPQGRVVLKNLIWKPTPSFMDAIDSKRRRSYLTKRIEKLEKEMETARQLLKNFIDELHWINCGVEIGFYNDELDIVKTSRYFKEFKDKYLL